MAVFFLLALRASADTIPGEWILTWKKGDPSWNTETRSHSHFRTLDSKGRFALWRHSRLPPLSPLVRVTPNFSYSAIQDPEFSKSWGLSNEGQFIEGFGTGIPGMDTGALGGWAISDVGSSVVIALLDSGISENHLEWNSPFAEARWNFVDDNDNVQDDNGHGTLCAGVMAAKPDNGIGSRGILRRSKILPVKFLDNHGNGTTAGAISSIDYAKSHGAKIINASWGGTEFDPALFDAIREVGEAGILFVAAAGNDGRDNDVQEAVYPASFQLPQLISVAAMDPKGEIASFSNFGKKSVHLAAPGVAIYSTALHSSFQFVDGTSFAAPFVSAGAALLWSFAPELTVTALKARLLSTTEVIHYYEKERLQSAGRLNLGNALLNFRPPRPKGPTHWERYAYFWETPHPYENKSFYQVTVKAERANYVRVHFKSFDTEKSLDRVQLKDRNGRVLATYSGKLGDFWSAEGIGSELAIEFSTDVSATRPGFSIDAFESSMEPLP